MFAIWVSLCLFNFAFYLAAQRPPQDETCDPEWFGRPKNQDCKDALARLPDWNSRAQLGNEVGNEEWGVIREFVNAGTAPRIGGPNSHEDNVQTPLIYTNGG